MVAADLGDDPVGRFGRYWLALLTASDEIPDRARFDPAAIQPLLPYILVVEELGDAVFRYRLLGTQIDWFARRNYTGMTTDEIPGHGPGNMIHAAYTAAIGTGSLVGCTMPYVGRSAVCRSVRKVAAPFRTPEGGRQVIALIQFDLVQGVQARLLPPEKRRVL